MSIMILDPTLRDGSHANQHQFTLDQIRKYCRAAESAGIPIVEVGHGNGLGASSLQVGMGLETDHDLIVTARESLSKTKLGVFAIPGFATVHKDIKAAIDLGVDVVRVGAHCTEADITERHVGFVREKGKIAYTSLMMAHMAAKEVLIEECRKMESYGSQGVILMDSAGAFSPADVIEKISAIVAAVTIPIGFHAHNNLGLAIANSLTAAQAGATIIDGTARGFGAGAGNAQLEVLIPVLHKMGYETGVDLYKVLDLADIAEKELMATFRPAIDSTSIVSGLAGVFSGFKKHVTRVSKEYNVDPRDVFFELGRRQVVGGQEDLIVEVAIALSKHNP